MPRTEMFDWGATVGLTQLSAADRCVVNRQADEELDYRVGEILIEHTANDQRDALEPITDRDVILDA